MSDVAFDPATPYYDLSPVDQVKNLQWRIRMREAALHDPDLQATLRQAAFEDPLFFFQAFMFCVEPRGRAKILPFCLWPHQIPAILAIDKAISDSEGNMEEPIDVVIDKARAQGATWICLGLILLRWLRDDMFSAGLVTRNMDACDNADDPSSLMPKLDWAIKMLPYWMRPQSWNPRVDRLISKHSLTNRDNGATIVGYAATGDVARSGRNTMFFFDEVAAFEANDAEDAMNSTQFVANCRVFCSTHNGDTGVYYDMVFGDSAGVKVVLDWKDNPTHSRLLYRIVNGQVMPERPEEAAEVMKYAKKHAADLERLKRRGFVKENKLRSKWYDTQCLRKGVAPRGIAQELDRDPRGTVGKLFDMEVLDRMLDKYCKPPLWEGTPVIRSGKLYLIKQEGGFLKLWFLPGLDDSAPLGNFVVGADIGTGTDSELSSNSVLVGTDSATGEQILEYADSGIAEARLAYLAVALAEWLHNALIIWEATGPTGKRFANAVMKESNYAHIYKRERENVRSHEKMEVYGWNNNKTSDKADLFEDLWVAMDEGNFTPRSDLMIRECGGWEWKDGKIIYRGTGHGDRSIATGLAWKGMKDLRVRGLDKPPEAAQNAPYGTPAWRMEQRKRAAQRDDDDDLFAGFRREAAYGE